MKRETLTPYQSFKSDRERLWALISRDIRIVVVTALCVGAGTTGFTPALRDVFLRWIA